MMKKTFCFLALAFAMVALCSCQGGNAAPKQQGDAERKDSLSAAKGDAKEVVDELAALPQAERDTLTVRFVEEFYSHAPEKGGAWDEDVLRRYLAPEVLAVLKAEADKYREDGSDFEYQYASWWLTGTDFTGQVVLRKHWPAMINDQGECQKRFDVYYWGDGMLQGMQLLGYKVGGPLNHLQITHIDGMDDESVDEVFDKLESRNEGREIDAEVLKDGAEDEEDE